MTTRWTIGIDWNRDGSYTDETASVLFAKWMLGFQRAYMDVGNDAKLTLLMRNEDKRFTPENSAGSLYGKLAPLRPVKIESNDGTTARALIQEVIFPPALADQFQIREQTVAL